MSTTEIIPERPAPLAALPAVLSYAQRGRRMFPVHTTDADGHCSCRKADCDRAGKHPRTAHGLKDATTNAAMIQVWDRQYPGCNWAVATGPESQIFAVDIDPGGESALAAWEKEHGSDWLKTLHAETPRGQHFYFKYPEHLETDGFEIVNSTGELASGIDIRGKGGYVIVPPSHRHNGCYKWNGDGPDTPILAAPEWLLKLVIRPIATPKIAAPSVELAAGERIADGTRNDTLFRFRAAMRRHGATRDAIEAALQVVNAKQCDPPLSSEEVGGIAASEMRYDPEPDDWPDPQPIACDPVDPFTLNLLPESLRPLVSDIAERMQVPPDFPGAAVTVGLAGCVNRRALVQPKCMDTGWELPLNLWGAIVAVPGTLKSPLLSAVTQPLKVIENGWREENAQAMQRYELRDAEIKLRQEIWARGFKAGTLAPDGTRPDSIQPPPQKRLLLTDCTSEKAHEMLTQNPGGLYMLRDEMIGFLATLDKAGREADRGFYLTSWSGCEGYAVDRIGRGQIWAPHVCLSLFGLIQPARLQHYMRDVIAGTAGPNNDGLFQRLQVLVCSDTNPGFTLVDRRPDANALATAQRIFSGLVELPHENPLRLHFDPNAQGFFDSWFVSLEREIRNPGDLPTALVAHLAKYRGLLPRLAALFELADRIAAGESFSAGQQAQITLAHTEQAASFCRYLRSHAQRIYGGMISPERDAARDLSEKLQHGKLPNPFTTRNLYRKCWSGMNTPEARPPRTRTAGQFGLGTVGW